MTLIEDDDDDNAERNRLLEELQRAIEELSSGSDDDGHVGSSSSTLSFRWRLCYRVMTRLLEIMYLITTLGAWIAPYVYIRHWVSLAKGTGAMAIGMTLTFLLLLVLDVSAWFGLELLKGWEATKDLFLIHASNDPISLSKLLLLEWERNTYCLNRQGKYCPAFLRFFALDFVIQKQRIRHKEEKEEAAQEDTNSARLVRLLLHNCQEETIPKGEDQDRNRWKYDHSRWKETSKLPPGATTSEPMRYLGPDTGVPALFGCAIVQGGTALTYVLGPVDTVSTVIRVAICLLPFLSAGILVYRFSYGFNEDQLPPHDPWWRHFRYRCLVKEEDEAV